MKPGLRYQAWAAGVERRAGVILALSLLIALVSAFSLTKVRLDFDVLGMLPAGRPAFDDFKSFVGEFGELNELVVLIEGRPAEELRRFADAFAEELSAADTVVRVQARIDVERIRRGVLGRYLYNYLPEESYEDLRKRLTSAGIEARVRAHRTVLDAPFDLTAAQAIAEDPLGVRTAAAQALSASAGEMLGNGAGTIASPDGTSLLVFAQPRESAFDIFFTERLLAQVGEAEAEARRRFPQLEVNVETTGSYVYALEDAETLRWDIRRYAVLALTGVLAVFFLGYRSFRLLPFVAYPLVVTTLLTFAFSLIAFEQLNAVSISFAAILYGLSIDAGIHFYTRLLQEDRNQAPHRAVAAALAALARAHVTASLTSIAVFCVIGLSVLGAVRQLGLLTAVGMLINTIEFFTLYPALGFVLLRSGSGTMHSLETPLLERATRGALAYARPLVAATAALGIVWLAMDRGVAVDVSLDHLRPQKSEAMRVERKIAERFSRRQWAGAALIERPSLEEALADGEVVASALDRLRRDGVVADLQSIEAILPSARTQRQRLALYDSLPRAAALDHLRAALHRNGFAAAPFAAFEKEFALPRNDIVELGDEALEPVATLLARQVRRQEQRTIVTIYVQPAAGVSLRRVSEQLHAALGDVAVTVTGRTLLEEELGIVLRRELVGFFSLALGLNFVLLRLSLGSVRSSLGVLLPAVLVVALLLAAMSVLGAAVNPVNLVIIPLILGLSVDDGLYVTAGARERGGWPEAVRHGGRAIVVTSLTTIAGFGFLGMSSYPALASLGILAGVGLSLCLVSSMILVPSWMTVLSAPANPAAGRGGWRRREIRGTPQREDPP